MKNFLQTVGTALHRGSLHHRQRCRRQYRPIRPLQGGFVQIRSRGFYGAARPAQALPQHCNRGEGARTSINIYI